MRIVAVLVLTLTLSGCIALGNMGDGCRFTAERNATVAVGSAAQAKIIARAGKLTVQGRPGLNAVRIVGKACASKQELLDQIELVAEERGGEIFIEARLPQSSGWLGNSDTSLGLEIETPERLTLDVEDGSGSVSVRGVAALRLKDGSGSVDVEDIAGDVFVQDGSGSIQVKAIKGNVGIKDGSGGLSVTDVAGGVDVQDGSGSLSISDVERSVKVRDGSGGMRISRVGGDVTVTRDGSGEISVSHVEGSFTVESDGSGSVHHEDIGGHVSVSD